MEGSLFRPREHLEDLCLGWDSFLGFRGLGKLNGGLAPLDFFNTADPDWETTLC